MNKLTSIYFDFIRAIAAILVVFHHYSQHIIKAFHGGQTVFPPIGQEAVMVFFVLSGFVISWVAEVKEQDPTKFFIKRFARFYSVMVPSVVILAVAYGLVMQINPDLYRFQGDANLFSIKALLTFSFLNFNSFVYAKLPGGAPFWSLTYEFWYYVIFALIVFLPKRWMAIPAAIAIFAVVGLDALSLWPVWLLGVVTYWASKRVTWGTRTAGLLYGLSLVGLVTLSLSGWRYSYLSLDYHFGWDWRYASHAVYYFLLGLLMSLNFLAFIAWSKHQKVDIAPWLEIPIRHMAGVSFTLYLIHVPLMLTLYALLGGYGIHYLLPVLAIAIVVVIGQPIEQSKFAYQKALSAIAKQLQVFRKAIG
ncbi:MAG: acyltransferase [Cyanobacteria bacterium P01_D01_bin.128]